LQQTLQPMRRVGQRDRLIGKFQVVRLESVEKVQCRIIVGMDRHGAASSGHQTESKQLVINL